MTPSGFSRIVLPNGLTILIQKKEHGTVSFGIGVRFGTAHHPVSHLIEHLLFTGTKTRTEEEIRQRATEWGGYHDAYVGFFSTFFVTKNLSVRGYEPLEILCDMTANSAFSEEKIENQRNVTLDEHEKRSNEPETMLMNRIYRTLYCDTPLERAVVDDTEVLQDIARADLVKLYKTRYVPSQLIVIGVGPIDIHRVTEIVKKYFPQQEKKNVEEMIISSEMPEPPSGKITIPRVGASQVHLMAGFRTVPRTHPDFYPLRVFSMILGESTDSRLFRATRGIAGLVYSITSHFDTVRSSRESVLRADCTVYHGALRIYSFFKPRNIRRVENIIKEELRKLTERLVSSDELKRNQNRVIGKHLQGTQGTHQEMRMLFAAEVNNSIEEFFDFEEKIKAVTAEDVLRVAQQFCDPSQGVWVTTRPKSDSGNHKR
ncbi:MAG: insulinase family protein [Parcubacteria group bacterium]|nr:insulinase family protein [Parcubacteria group bacterium]